MAEDLTEKKGVRWFYRSMNYYGTAGVEPAFLYLVLPIQHKFCGHVTEVGYCSAALTPTFLSSQDLMVSGDLGFHCFP